MTQSTDFDAALKAAGFAVRHISNGRPTNYFRYAGLVEQRVSLNRHPVEGWYVGTREPWTQFAVWQSPRFEDPLSAFVYAELAGWNFDDPEETKPGRL